MKTNSRFALLVIVTCIFGIVYSQNPAHVADAGLAGAASNVLYADDFEQWVAGDNPADWLDTAARNSMAVDDTLFAVATVDNSQVLQTTSSDSNIHSHYVGNGSGTFSDFSFSGRMQITNPGSGIGVTFLSDYNQSDSYYRLRRYGNNGSFHLSPHGTTISGGTNDTGVVPQVDTWYQFRIEVEDSGSQTNIRARVWEAGSAEPATWQIDAYDSSSSRRTTGTVGVWSYKRGNKAWDDLLVESLAPAGPYVLTTTGSTNGSIVLDPDLTEYSDGSSVQTTALPDDGWIFLEWSGDLSGNDNPQTLVMDGDKTISALFVEDVPQTLTIQTVGNGTATPSPSQVEYTIGTVVTVTATADSGWHFAGWSGDLAGNQNPATLVLNSSKTITATFSEEPPYLVNADFAGGEASLVDWQDTGANNSMVEDDTLFTTALVDGDSALTTSSTLDNIHSHYKGTDSAAFADYVYTGRMMVDDNQGGIGVTFLSDYNQTDSYYRLRRYGTNGSFHLSPHGTALSGGATDSGLVPQANIWYQFRIEVEDTGSQTNIRGRIWEAGSTEPETWQIDAYDSSSNRLTTGTIGVWGYGVGSKSWDDLTIAYLSGGPFTLAVQSVGQGSVNLNPDQVTYDRGSSVTLTAIPEAGSEFAGWSGGLQGSENPTTISMNADQAITATFTTVPTFTLTTSVSGSGSISVDPEQTSYEENSVVSLTAIPAAGWRFAGWSGSLSGTANPISLTMVEDSGVTATFVEDLPLMLSVNSIGNGSTTTSPAADSYPHGSILTVTATAASGWRFDRWAADPVVAGGWWSSQWDYRLPLTVTNAANGVATAETAVDFTAAWGSLGISGELDLNSLRVIEVDGTGKVVDGAVPFQFDPAAAFNATTNATGTLVILLPENAPVGERSYHVYFDTTGKSFSPVTFTRFVTITDNVADEGLTTYRIENGQSTYYYDKAGGGFSSLLDRDGNDWIGYNATAGAGGTYRGIPNLVYPEGYMHPGENNVTSTIVHQGPLKVTVRSISNDNNWETLWSFYPGFARLTVVRAANNYWVLYEGTPGGLLEPNTDIVVRASGTQTLAGQSWTGDLIGDEWVYFGDPNVGRSLYLLNHQQDGATDSYWPLDGTMTVFGFGRDGLNRYLSTTPALFTVGLAEDTTYSAVAGEISGVAQPATTAVGAAQSRTAMSVGQDPVLNFEITANQVLTATFVELISPTLSVAISGSGTVLVEPDLPQYSYGQTITVTAVPDGGFYFAGWSGDQTGSSNPLVFSIWDNTNLAADFAEDVPLSLTVNTVGDGSVSLTPDQLQYNYGDVVTLTAVGNSDWQFESWSGALSGNQNPNSITMYGDTSVTATFVQNLGQPSIDVWYGDRQRFGHIGMPQPWFNILGNVFDEDGIASLEYSLNSAAPRTLSVGADDRRLENAGDFNVDLYYQDLIVGDNRIVITATDSLGFEATEIVTVTYESGNTWPATYTVDWSSATRIEDVAQVVDGKWAITPDGLRILEPGYDRLVAIGDLGWTDYEVTVPITIHEVDYAGAGGLSGGPGLGLLMRWQGHTDTPVYGWQPKSGWVPNGAIGWWRWYSGTDAYLVFFETGVGQQFSPQLETQYIFKMRVESTPGQGGLYRVKVWEEGQPEPAEWNLSYQEGASDVANGSFLLLAHHVEATFGTVAANPLGEAAAVTLTTGVEGAGVVTADPDKLEYGYGELVTLTATPNSGWLFSSWQGDLSGNENPVSLSMIGSKQVTATFVSETAPPAISSIAVAPYSNAAIVTWQTDKPASSAVAYGTSNAYEVGTETDSILKTSHAITLTGLLSNTVYHYQITAVDGNGNSSSTADATFTTPDGTPPSAVESDDFNACAVNDSLWSFVDPRGDGSVAINGTQLALSVPSGTGHDVWSGGNMAPRLMQTVADEDFELEVKFESAVSEQYEMQGVIVEQDAGNFLRFDSYSDGGQVWMFAAHFVGGSPTAIANVGIGAVSQPLYMRISRSGDTWTQSYSTDGTNWSVTSSFVHALTVDQVGVFAGNSGSNPAHTALVDYFFNTAAPIIPEDGNGNPLAVNVDGGGTVTQTPEKALYTCGESVDLTATPDSGWLFAGWSGAVSGSTNPVTLVMDADKVVTATFTADNSDTVPPAIGSVQVMPGIDSATVTWQTDEPASSAVAYGTSNAYEVGTETDSILKTSHAITLTGLLSNTVYHYQITAVDGNGNSSSTADATFTTPDGTPPSAVESDDFNACAVNDSLWSFVDPRGDGSVAINGTQLALSVPSGTGHDVWSGGNMAPRLMQTVADEDFELEVKFESAVSEQYEMQGVIVEQDAGNFLRFDSYSDGGQVWMFAAHFVGGSPTAIANVGIGAVSQPLYMRISRSGDTWTQSYSTDGTNWSVTSSFVHALTVDQVGVFAGNSGSNPAHTALVDYFFNTAAPIIPEDGQGVSCN